MKARRSLLTLLLFAAALLASVPGCRPLVGVKATVRVDDQTRLERQVLGRRGEVAPEMVLMPIEGASQPEEELRRLYREYSALDQRLAGVTRQTAELRAWHVISLHNRAVLQARLGNPGEAMALMEDAVAHARAFRFATLEWQVLMSKAVLAGGDEGAALLALAAERLTSAPLLTELDYSLESGARSAELFGRVVDAALARSESEEAIGYVLAREAVDLARALPPGGLSVPAGEVGDVVRALAAARAVAADAREALCSIPFEDLAQEVPPTAVAACDVALGDLEEVRGRVGPSSSVAGLLVPDPADVLAIQELLAPDTALVVIEPIHGDRYAAFVLRADGLATERLDVPIDTVEAASVRRALSGTLSKDALSSAAAALLGPLGEHLGTDVQRLYLACPPALSALAWQILPLGDTTLGERFEVAFLGGPSDLLWAFERKRYGRESVFVCGGMPGGLDKAAGLLDDPSRASLFDVRHRNKSDLPQELALSDVLFFTNPLELRPTAPAESHLVFPGELRLLSSVTAGELAAYRTRAACAGFASVSSGAFGRRSSGSLRLVTRALLAAGVPSVLYGIGVERVPGGGADYWRPFLSAVREGAAAAAHRRASTALAPRYRPAFRLYGFLGMNHQEYEEFSKLEFNDTARSATAHLAGGRFQQAAAAFLQLAQMARARQLEPESQRVRLLAQIEQHLVRCFHEMRDYERAVTHQQKVIVYLADFEGTPGPLSAVAYQSLGALLTEAERFEEATDAYGRCIELLREHGEAGDVAKVLGELGKSLDRAAEYERALGTFQEALEVYRELRRPAGAAKQHQRIGAIYLKRLNSAPRAEEHFLEARRLYEEAGEQAEVIESTIDIGLCRRALGDLDGALKLFAQASGQATDGALPHVEARALSEIGNTRWLRGEYQAALDLVNRSNQIAQQLDEAFRLNVNYQLLGLIYWELNEHERALRALDTAIEAAGRAQAPLDMASAYNNRGIIYRRRGEYARALESFEQALEVDVRLRSRWGQAYDHRNIGMTLHRMGRHEEASQNIGQAVALSRAIQDRVNLAKALLACGELQLDQGRAGESEASLREALQMSRDVYLPEVEWRALRALGRLRRGQGDEAGALQALQQGVEVVERLRGTIKVEEFQSGFLTNKMDLYEDVVGLLLDMGRMEEALSYAERSRARKFIDVLARQSFELRTDRERELYARQADLSRRARALREALAREQDAESRAVLGRQLDEIQRDYSDTLVDIRVANPALSSFVTVAVAEPKRLVGMLPADVAVVVYYLMPDELAIWVLRGSTLEVRRVPVSRDELTARIRAYRLMVQNRELLDEVRRASLELYDLLVAPVQDLLQGNTVVGIVPHRALHYLSFASLYDGEGFLVERRALFYVPSASALQRTLELELAPARSELQVLAVGNPAVGDPAYELPFTEREVASIRRDFVNVVTLTGERATEDWVKENIERFDVVHIGAHGRFDPVNPLFSSLVLARQEDDGLLHLHEVTGLQVNARLVTLSACQSGLGALGSADELVSLSRAFTYAGTRSILSTLWRVDDVATALVTKHFYRRYVDNGAAASLRYAQLQVMNDGRHYHPTYWAGVTLSGDFR